MSPTPCLGLARGGEGRTALPHLCGRTGRGWQHRTAAYKRNRLGGKLSKSHPAVVKTNAAEYIHTHSTPPSTGAAQARLVLVWGACVRGDEWECHMQGQPLPTVLPHLPAASTARCNSAASACHPFLRKRGLAAVFTRACWTTRSPEVPSSSNCPVIFGVGSA